MHNPHYIGKVLTYFLNDKMPLELHSAPFFVVNDLICTRFLYG